MKTASIQGVPLEYIQSILKIDDNSPSGLSWLVDRKNGKSKRLTFAGCIVKYKNYKSWRINLYYQNKSIVLKCSRIIFLLHKGYLAKNKNIDHIDGNPLNNRVENLREATDYENNQNSKLPKNNTSGIKGVYWDKKSKKWRVMMYAYGKNHYFGFFESYDEAVKVAMDARKKLHGEFGRDK